MASVSKRRSPVRSVPENNDEASNELIEHGLAAHDASNRIRRIQEAAYRLAETRGFAPGAELEDWLAAERLVDAEDAARSRSASR